ncbi:hypothetical protein C4J81_17675 [Deltaproteobacteria bacterium Smac51]|nr:hypothetical protein C4J81_17675 [Deltaproteobacteria bacterium Smac51]
MRQATSIVKIDGDLNSRSNDSETERQRLVLKPKPLPAEQKSHFLLVCEPQVYGKKTAMRIARRITMAISSAMYAAVTGMKALSTGMQTISNNIANVNTVGFKAGRTNYEDLISQSYTSGGKSNQVGTGVKVSSVQTMFTQGSFMSSAQDTDLAIAGEGFFSVRNSVTGAINYTRAGNFTLSNSGYLEDPSGNILQGWQMSTPKPGESAVRIGAPTDVKITVMNAPPEATSQIKVAVNLNADDEVAYNYEQYELAASYADQQAVPVAESARVSTIAATYPTTDSPRVALDGTPGASTADAASIVASSDDIYNASFLYLFNDRYIRHDGSGNANANPSDDLTSVTQIKVVDDSVTLTQTDRDNGCLTISEYNQLSEDATGPVATLNGVPGHYTSATNYSAASINSSGNDLYDTYFTELYNSYHTTSHTSLADFKVVKDGVVLTDAERRQGFMTEAEFNSLVVSAKAEARAEATARGRDAYNNMYNNIYDSTYKAITSRLTDWQLEGNGFAGAWDASESPYIDTDNYTHVEAVTIYDSLGAEHKMMIYYQPNPHMDNVWDYIITCDPLEDARKDSNNNLLMSDTSTFSGLIQKGKITFSTDGVIKDIEAQNIDLEKTKMATTDPAQYTSSTTTTMRNATIGGYYNGSPSVNPYTGMYESSSRTYSVSWGGNVQSDPVTSGLIWTDNAGNSGVIPVYDKQFAGPYSFGSGMTITFDTQDLPLRFGTVGADSLEVTANSEQTAWTNIQPNEQGYFDFDVAFVQSASMALHPPYPEGMPTVIQNISFDMGAKNPYGLSASWTLDEMGTTQYATKSSTVFNNANGYPSGSLQRVSIGEDGVVTGVYSNGSYRALYQIGLTKFINPWGLEKLGDNLYAETRYSGTGSLNEPGTGGTGTVLANYLEQSNVDLSEEIVNMIVTQRGFQANSKTITTTDSMLEEVISMKR